MPDFPTSSFRPFPPFMYSLCASPDDRFDVLIAFDMLPPPSLGGAASSTSSRRPRVIALSSRFVTGLTRRCIRTFLSHMGPPRAPQPILWLMYENPASSTPARAHPHRTKR